MGLYKRKLGEEGGGGDDARRPNKRSSLDLAAADRPVNTIAVGPWNLSLRERHWACAEELNAALATAAAHNLLDVNVRGVQHFCRVPAGRGLIAGRLAESAARAARAPAALPPPAAAAAPPPTDAAAAAAARGLGPRTPPPDDPDAAAHAALAAALLASPAALAPFPEHGASVYRLATPACLHSWAARWFGRWTGDGGTGAAAQPAPPPVLQVVALHGWGCDSAAPLGHPAPPRALGQAGAPREAPARTVWVPVFQQ